VSTNAVGWVAFVLGNAGMWLVPRSRHGWLLTICSAALWALVDVWLSLWPGLVGAGMAVVMNARCWRKRVSSKTE
jgi:hypothetical protein